MGALGVGVAAVMAVTGSVPPAVAKPHDPPSNAPTYKWKTKTFDVAARDGTCKERVGWSQITATKVRVKMVTSCDVPMDIIGIEPYVQRSKTDLEHAQNYKECADTMGCVWNSHDDATSSGHRYQDFTDLSGSQTWYATAKFDYTGGLVDPGAHRKALASDTLRFVFHT